MRCHQCFVGAVGENPEGLRITEEVHLGDGKVGQCVDKVVFGVVKVLLSVQNVAGVGAAVVEQQGGIFEAFAGQLASLLLEQITIFGLGHVPPGLSHLGGDEVGVLLVQSILGGKGDGGATVIGRFGYAIQRQGTGQAEFVLRIGITGSRGGRAGEC